MNIIFDFNRTIYDPESLRLFEGVLELLNNLKNNHNLFLVTMFTNEREANIDSLGLNEYFIKIASVAEKNKDIFSDLLTGYSDQRTLVVGDRVRGEIKIGNELGFTTIWLKSGKFSLEAPQNKLEVPDYIIEDIAQLKNIIEKI